jgi:putative RecB family exonuclease
MAVWAAIERACREEDFRPHPSALCNFCNFRAFCPAYGGSPEEAALAIGVGASGAA